MCKDKNKKKDIIKELSTRTGFSLNLSKRIINDLVDILVQELKSGHLNLKNLGVSVIVISHRMDDIFSVCDRVMALFQGTNFAESMLKDTSRDEVIGWIMGKKD